MKYNNGSVKRTTLTSPIERGVVVLKSETMDVQQLLAQNNCPQKIKKKLIK